MKPKEYIELAIKTENRDFDGIRKRLLFTTYIRLDHAAKGMVTEAAEFTDALKKYEFYGKDFDVVNLVEELGDLLWYIALACDTIGTSFEEIMERNIAKLKARYGEKFNEEDAINRDLENERNILANNIIHHYLRGNPYTSCGKPTILLDNVTDSILNVNCDKCLETVKVNYDRSK